MNRSGALNVHREIRQTCLVPGFRGESLSEKNAQRSTENLPEQKDNE
jgi:hypothetical protein